MVTSIAEKGGVGVKRATDALKRATRARAFRIAVGPQRRQRRRGSIGAGGGSGG